MAVIRAEASNILNTPKAAAEKPPTIQPNLNPDSAEKPYVVKN